MSVSGEHKPKKTVKIKTEKVNEVIEKRRKGQKGQSKLEKWQQEFQYPFSMPMIQISPDSARDATKEELAVIYRIKSLWKSR